MDIFTGDKYHLFLLCSDVAYMAPFSCIMRVAYTMIIKVKRYIRILDHKTSLNAFCFRAYSRFVVLDYAKDSFTSRIISVLYKLQNKSIFFGKYSYCRHNSKGLQIYNYLSKQQNIRNLLDIGSSIYAEKCTKRKIIFTFETLNHMDFDPSYILVFISSIMSYIVNVAFFVYYCTFLLLSSLQQQTNISGKCKGKCS